MANGPDNDGFSTGDYHDLPTGRLALKDEINDLAKLVRRGERSPTAGVSNDTESPRLSVDVRISQAAPWKGTYYGKLIEASEAEFDPDDDVTENDLGDVAEVDNVIFVDVGTVNGGSSSLAEGQIVTGTVRSQNEDGYLVVHGGGSGSLPTGQYQYQGYRMVTQNVAGWEYDLAHPMQG